MANPITKCIILATLFVAMRLINAQPKVPCFFLFGDSYFDNGNNNNLISLAKANFLPYGIDFVSGPTGRATNGFNIPDFLAQSLGFTTPSPPFATAGGSNAILRGLNYASNAAGILDDTSLQVLQRFTMNQQLLNHQGTVNQMPTLAGNQTAATNLLRQCLYAVNIGINDYVNNYYLLPITLSRLLYTPETFAERLIQQYSQQLRTLYNLEARKVAVFAITPAGCTPQMLLIFPTNSNGSCVDFINNSVQLFNTKLISLINDLNTNLSGAKFTYINTYGLLSGNFSTTLGIRVPNAPCCQVSVLGACIPNGGVCSNRDEYTYFDNIHPTQIVARFVASIAFVSQSPSDATPVDIRTLGQQ